MHSTRHNNNMHTMFFDGCSKGNPGRAGAGAVIYDASGNEVFAESVFAGYSTTNNEAEYTGLILGLNAALKCGIAELQVRGDSQLVIRQMQGKYRVNSPKLTRGRRAPPPNAIDLKIEPIQYNKTQLQRNYNATTTQSTK